jgi:hypothetical protein
MMTLNALFCQFVPQRPPSPPPNNTHTHTHTHTNTTPVDRFIPLVPGATKGGRVLGLGVCGVDLLAYVDKYPEADAKIRTADFQVQGGGNAGNTLTGWVYWAALRMHGCGWLCGW